MSFDYTSTGGAPVENLPGAARVFQALRGLGYSLNAAVADLVDNSISAKSCNIRIDFKREKNKFTILVEDNGCGMSRDKLFEAMRLGSDGEYTEQDLGKFGMGLKTASLSQCRKLTVVSCSKDKMISGFQWDIDYVEKTNKWEMLELSKSFLELDLRFKSLIRKSGTIVIWENMDHIDNEIDSFKNRAAADNYTGKIIGDLQLHLRMTFHRFLDGSLGEKNKVRINFNGVPIEPWDPFCRDEEYTRILETKTFIPSESTSKKEILIEPFILPAKEGKARFSTLKAWSEAKGPLSWNDSQGYYIYRANRLIHFGGWMRTRAKDEHTKYARVAISFPTDLDDAFNISVQKTQIRLPASLFEYLKTEVNPEVIAKTKIPYSGLLNRSDASNRHKKSTRILNVTAKAVLPKRMVTVKEDKYGKVTVSNPRGTFIANTVTEALRINIREKFGVQTGKVEDGKLWSLVCKPNGGFVVVLNKEHEFYKNAYDGNDENRVLVKFMDAILFAMAYAELYSASNGTKEIFEEIRETVSTVLEEVAKTHF